MQRIPPVEVGERLELVSATVPGPGDDTSPYRLEYRAVSVLTCPFCGHRHPVKNRTSVEVRDIPYGDHPLILVVEEGSTYCRVTKQHLACDLPDREGALTGALVRYLRRHFGQAPRRTLARRTDVSEKMIRAVQLAPLSGESAPLQRIDYLGVDDIYILKGRYLVATDLSAQTIVALERVGTIVEGRASAVDMRTFFSALPDAVVVTLDMHAEQLAAAKARWPLATLVIDKRHLLGIIDRDLLKLVSDLMFGRWMNFGDLIAAKQAVRSFGLKAYPYLSLRALVLRRRRNLTPADHAAWTLLLLEGQQNPQFQAQQLWEAYQWREALYDVYDASKPTTVIRAGLERWMGRMEEWRRQGKEEPPPEAPFPRISWAIRTYWKEILAYADTGATNATTELINGRIRAHLRRGHRYDARSLITLINREAEASGSESPIPPPITFQFLVPEPDAVAAPPASSVQSTPRKRPKRARKTVPVIGMAATWQSSARPSRALPKQAPELDIPAPVWIWLHSRAGDGRGRREGGRWFHLVLRAVESADEAAMWGLCCAGQIRNANGLSVTPAALERWRAVVQHRFVVEHPGGLAVSERERQPRLRELRLNTVYDCCPAVHKAVAKIYATLLKDAFVKLKEENQQLLTFIESWHHFYSGSKPVRTEVLEARPWQAWPGAITSVDLEPSSVERSLMNASFGWALHMEWFMSQHPGGEAMQEIWRMERLDWQERFASELSGS